MNLQKFTKADLISKIKTLQTKKTDKNNNNSDQSIGPIMIKTFGYMKAILLKLTIITFLIKTFRKYSLIRKVWVLLNTIVMTIFGISILEIYGISFIAAFFIELWVVFGNVVSYLTNTQIYTTISGLFGAKVAIKESATKIKSMKEINSNSTGSKEKIRISDWLHKEEIVEKDDNSHRKYLLLLWLLLIAGGLSWYYWGDISPHLPNLPGFPNLFSKKPKPKTDDIDPLDIVYGPKENKSWWGKWKSWRDGTQKKLDEKVVDLKAEAANKATSSKDSIDHYFPEINVEDKTGKVTELERKLLKQLTGENANKFEIETNTLVAQMNHFLVLNKTDIFPNQELKNTLYEVIKNKLVALSLTNKLLYDQWISKNSVIADKIDRFFDLENDNTQLEETEVKSETYGQVELETIQEQDVWSDKVKSPSVKSEAFNNYAVEETEQIVDKPKPTFTNWLDAIRARRDDTNVIDSHPVIKKTNKPESIILETKDLTSKPYEVSTINQDQAQELLQQAKDVRKEVSEVSNTLSELIDKSNKLDDSELMSAVKKTFNEDLQMKVETSNKPELPEIKVDKADTGSSSNNSLDHYFPETKLDKGKSIDMTNLSQSEIDRRATTSDVEADVTETPGEEAKSLFGSIIDKIKSQRLEYGTPKISQVGLGTSDSPQLLSPLKTKPSITNLFDDTADLFDIDNDINDPQSTPVPTNTPEITTEELPEQIDISQNTTNVPTSSNINQDNIDNYQMHDRDIINEEIWNKVETKVLDNGKVKFNFYDLKNQVTEISFCSNFKEVNDFYVDKSLFKHSSKAIHSKNWESIDISNIFNPMKDSFGNVIPHYLNEIYVRDVNNNYHLIYRKDK
jgi:hypothetical protein